jgi:hypothetical protein
VNSAPAVIAGLFLVTFLVALPAGLALRSMLQDHLGASLAAETAAGGVNYDWWQEFGEQATGVGVTFSTTIIGFGAVLDNLAAMADNVQRPIAVLGPAAAYLALWIFLVGGVIDRYARNRPTRTHSFFAACGTFGFRFLRLAVIAGLVYYVLFAQVHSWLFDRFYPWATRDFTVERSALLLRAGLYMVFGAMLAATTMVFDYAKIRAVVEDRRSMIGALAAAVRFVSRNPRSVAGLYALNGLAFVVVLALYALVAPGAGTAGLSVWTGLLIGQAYLLARIWVKLLFYASQTAYFQGALAHADYTAAPPLVWPESPAAEAIWNAGKRHDL